ncbi:MAG: TerB family tellurite resistance protein [Desulfatiglandaceae bacterium]|jgi:uncharacterized tellurite resistance protein B-like protein
MLDIAKRLFGKFKNGSQRTQEPSASGKDLRVAACSLLLEMAETDGKFLGSERERILSIIQQEYDLSDKEAVSLLERSQQELDESIDLWRFSNNINQHYSLDEKIRLIENVWEIAFTDGNLEQHEDYLVHKLANLLRLSHKQLIDAKMKVLARGSHRSSS